MFSIRVEQFGRGYIAKVGFFIGETLYELHTTESYISQSGAQKAGEELIIGTLRKIIPIRPGEETALDHHSYELVESS